MQSAKQAIKVYQKDKYSFKLIAVAQGISIKEYLASFQVLTDLGFEYIAIGGLLKRNGNSSFVTVRSDKFLETLLKEVREKFNPKWLFTFGTFHPKRIPLLEKYNVWGADYKGWLFQYNTTYANLLSIIKNEFQISLEKEDIKKIRRILEELKITSVKKEKFKLKKNLDAILGKYELSLQKIRIIQVLINLEKQLNLKKIMGD